MGTRGTLGSQANPVFLDLRGPLEIGDRPASRVFQERMVLQGPRVCLVWLDCLERTANPDHRATLEKVDCLDHLVVRVILGRTDYQV